MGVWVAMQNSAVIRLFHALTHECVCDVNLAPAVNKMLSGNTDTLFVHLKKKFKKRVNRLR